ncbi:MAG: hypothetical protein ACLU3I_19710 [Acutalibacteraceae bacterium]
MIRNFLYRVCGAPATGRWQTTGETAIRCYPGKGRLLAACCWRCPAA